MGQVFEAVDLELGTSVALKAIRPEHSQSPQMIRLFKNEVRLAREVTHPNVCRIFDLFLHYGDHDWGSRGQPVLFLTMELLQGPSLSTYLKKAGPLPTDEALPLLRDMAEALDAAHHQGILHQDFKSSNVILVEEVQRCRAIVTDFGVAHRADPHSNELSPPLRGTPAYMAPEVKHGGKATPEADVYAFGMVAFEILTGRRPNPRHSAENGRTLLSSKPVNGSQEWAAPLRRCLDPDPRRRFCSAGAAAEALAHAVTQKRDRGWRPRLRTAARVVAVAALLLLSHGAIPPDRVSGEDVSQLLLKGRQAYDRYDRESNEIAIEYLSRALEIDPEQASVRALLANAYALRAIRYGLSSDWHEQALATAHQALRIAPGLPEAHNAIGIVYLDRGYLSQARQALQRALELQEDLTVARHNLALLDMAEGHWDEAIEEFANLVQAKPTMILPPLIFLLNELGLVTENDRLLAVFANENPLHPFVHRILARRELQQGDVRAARDRLERVLVARPDEHLILREAGMAALIAGDFPYAEDLLRRARELDERADTNLLFAQALWLGGKQEPSRDLMQEIEETDLEAFEAGARVWTLFRRLAVIAALRGDHSLAIDYYERAAEGGNLGFWYDFIDPAFAALRGEPRFEQRLLTSKVEVDAMRRRVIENGWHRQALSNIDPRS